MTDFMPIRYFIMDEGRPSYEYLEVNSSPNVPYGARELTLQEAQSMVARKPNLIVSGLANREKLLSGQIPQSNMVAQYQAPWGETLQNVLYSQIQEIEKGGVMSPQQVRQLNQQNQITPQLYADIIKNKPIGITKPNEVPQYIMDKWDLIQKKIQEEGITDSSGRVLIQPQGQIQQNQQNQQNEQLFQEYDTGNNQLNEILKGLQETLDKTISAGKIVNPNIELTPAEIQSFLDQAEKEINPYYASQIASIKDDLLKNVQNLQKQYDIQKQESESQFKESLASQRESQVTRGTIRSGVGVQEEEALAGKQQRQLDLDALQREGKFGSSIRQLESQIGTQNLPQFPTFTSQNVSTQGYGGFTSGRTLNFPQTGGIFGTLPAQRLTDVQRRKNELETLARQSRVLNFY